MGREMLSFSEERYPEIIAIIRAGLAQVAVSESLRQSLLEWCAEGEAYWKRCQGGEEEEPPPNNPSA